MEKFKSELKQAKNPWIKRIGEYLLSRSDLHENLKKEDKSLNKCFDYILIELSKKCKKEGNVGYAAGDDEELYAMAVHYYDEDDIIVENKNFRTNADGTATKEDIEKTVGANPGPVHEKENKKKTKKDNKEEELKKDIVAKDKEIEKLKAELEKKSEPKPIKKEKKSKACAIEGQMSLFEV